MQCPVSPACPAGSALAVAGTQCPCVCLVRSCLRGWLAPIGLLAAGRHCPPCRRCQPCCRCLLGSNYSLRCGEDEEGGQWQEWLPASHRKPGLRFQCLACSLQQGVAGTSQARTGPPLAFASRPRLGPTLPGQRLKPAPFSFGSLRGTKGAAKSTEGWSGAVGRTWGCLTSVVCVSSQLPCSAG